MTPEGATLNAILEYLRIRHVFAWRNNTGAAKVGEGRDSRFIRYGLKGSSDISGCLDDGRMLAIEVKAPRGRVTQEQTDFLESISKRGGVAFVARSVEDVEKAIFSEKKGGIDARNS